MDYKTVTNCRVCGSDRLRAYLDFGLVPLANSLVFIESPKSQPYPIKVLLCGDCALSQLSIVVKPELMYSNYFYHSSVSKTFQKHCYKMAQSLMEFKVSDYPLVMDIASNDGCLLEQFRAAVFNRLMGIEPAENLTKEYLSKQLIVVNDFFSEKLVDSWDGEKCSFITATNVLAHVDDLGDFIRAVKKSLAPDGIFVAEVPYFNNLIKHNQFDTIYHEHLSYFLFHPLDILFRKYGLPIFRVEHYPIHGGSLRIYASKDSYDIESSVHEQLDFEKNSLFYDYETYRNFSNRVDGIREDLSTLLELLYHSDKKVVGYGASAKGISLLNYSCINSEWIQAIVDETEAKRDKLTPGTNILIVDFDSFEYVKPDYILLLAWNFADELIAKTKHLGAKYILPIPEVKVI